MRGLLILTALVPFLCNAQDGFPSGSTTPNAQELTAHLSGKSFHATYADGTRVGTRFEADGGLYATAPGFSDRGTWRVEDGKMCGTLRKMGAFCNDARFNGGAIYFRRLSGEIVRYDVD